MACAVGQHSDADSAKLKANEAIYGLQRAFADEECQCPDPSGFLAARALEPQASKRQLELEKLGETLHDHLEGAPTPPPPGESPNTSVDGGVRGLSITLSKPLLQTSASRETVQGSLHKRAAVACAENEREPQSRRTEACPKLTPDAGPAPAAPSQHGGCVALAAGRPCASAMAPVLASDGTVQALQAAAIPVAPPAPPSAAAGTTPPSAPEVSDDAPASKAADTASMPSSALMGAPCPVRVPSTPVLELLADSSISPVTLLPYLKPELQLQLEDVAIDGKAKDLGGYGLVRAGLTYLSNIRKRRSQCIRSSLPHDHTKPAALLRAPGDAFRGASMHCYCAK